MGGDEKATPARVERGARLRAARQARDWDQETLAVKCGWAAGKPGQSRISNYERGAREPTVDEWKILAITLGVSPCELIYGTNFVPDDERALLAGYREANESERRMILHMARSILAQKNGQSADKSN